MNTEIILSNDALENLKKIFSEFNAENRELDIFSLYINEVIKSSEQTAK